MSDYLYLFRGGVDVKTLPPDQQQKLMNSWFTWIGELRQTGNYRAGDPLDDGGRVVTKPGGSTITDGPFAEGKEEVGGYIIVTAQHLDHATALAKGCPILSNGGSVEIRPIVHLPEMAKP